MFMLQHKFGWIQIDKGTMTQNLRLTSFSSIFWAVGGFIWHRRHQVDVKLSLKRKWLQKAIFKLKKKDI